MTEREDRNEDRGRTARRADVKTWATIIGIAMTCGAILMRGGQVLERLENVGKEVAGVQASVQTLGNQISQEQLTQRELKIRVDNHDKELTNHDQRILRVEARTSRTERERN